MKKLITVALMTVFLAACGKTLDGTYADSTGSLKLTFKGNKLEFMGVEVEYKIEDGKVKFNNGSGATVVIPIKDDKTITFPMAGDLVKQ